MMASDAVNFLTANAPAQASIVWVVSRLLARTEPVDVAKLASRLAPPGSKGEASGALKASISVGEGIHVFVRDADRIHLDPEFAAVCADWENDFPFFADLFLDRLFQVSIESVKDSGSPSDLVRGLVWLVYRDEREYVPWSFRRAEDELGQLHQMQFNAEKWRPFLRWARALGFLRPSGTATYTVDLHRPLVSCISPPRERPARAFMETVGSRVPVMSDSPLVGEFARGSVEEVPPGLSYSLLRLEQQQRLELLDRADSGDSYTLTYGNYQRRFTHVRELS